MKKKLCGGMPSPAPKSMKAPKAPTVPGLKKKKKGGVPSMKMPGNM